MGVEPSFIRRGLFSRGPPDATASDQEEIGTRLRNIAGAHPECVWPCVPKEGVPSCQFRPLWCGQLAGAASDLPVLGVASGG
jgi:hypothetical protein